MAAAPTFIAMTATVTPAAGIGTTARADAATRLAEYLEAFQFYLALPDELVHGLVLLENSGHDLTPFTELARALGTRKQVHCLPVSPDYPAQRGKGYGEFLMLDRGLTQLRALGVSADARLWKVTGRLIVRNMAAMVHSAPPRFALYADFRHVPLIGHRLGGNDWLELRLIAVTMDGYDRYLRGHFGDGYVLEHAFFARLRPLVERRPGGGDADIVPRFRVQPEWQGRSGHSNQDYRSRGYRLKGALRAFTRRHLQFLWL